MTSNKEEFLSKTYKKLEFAGDTKKRMLERSKRKGYRKCPFCESGRVIFILAGSRNHLHGKCSTEGCFFIME